MKTGMRVFAVLGALVVGGSVVAPVAVSAAPPTSGLVKASASVKRDVVASINADRGTSSPKWCFDVWVTKSDSRWATWRWSKMPVDKMERCLVTDGWREFLRSTGGGGWVYAGRFSGDGHECLFTKAPPAAVWRDLGCDSWKPGS